MFGRINLKKSTIPSWMGSTQYLKTLATFCKDDAEKILGFLEKQDKLGRGVIRETEWMSIIGYAKDALDHIQRINIKR